MQHRRRRAGQLRRPGIRRRQRHPQQRGRDGARPRRTNPASSSRRRRPRFWSRSSAACWCSSVTPRATGAISGTRTRSKASSKATSATRTTSSRPCRRSSPMDTTGGADRARTSSRTRGAREPRQSRQTPRRSSTPTATGLDVDATEYPVGSTVTPSSTGGVTAGFDTNFHGEFTPSPTENAHVVGHDPQR